MVVMLHSNSVAALRKTRIWAPTSANLMLVAGTPVTGGHYIKPRFLRVSEEIIWPTFSAVYGTLISDWLGVPAQRVLGGHAVLRFWAELKALAARSERE